MEDNEEHAPQPEPEVEPTPEPEPERVVTTDPVALLTQQVGELSTRADNLAGRVEQLEGWQAAVVASKLQELLDSLAELDEEEQQPETGSKLKRRLW